MFGDLFENVFGLRLVEVRLEESEKISRTIHKDREGVSDLEENILEKNKKE